MRAGFYGIPFYSGGHQHTTRLATQATTQAATTFQPPRPVRERTPEELITPQQWLVAARTGRVNFPTVMANEARIPTNWFDAVVTSCGDVPTF